MIQIDPVASAFARIKEDMTSIQEEIGVAKDIFALLSTADAEKEDRITKLDARMARIEEEIISLQKAYADMGEAILDYLEEINRKVLPPQGTKKRDILLVRDA